MAKIPSPIGPTIDVASKTISSTIIRGGSGRGGGGGDVDPQTSSTVKRQGGDIILLRRDHNALVKTHTQAITTFNKTISGIQSFLGVISVNVKDLGGRILGVNNLLAADANLEAKKDKQELTQEKKLAEQGAREGKEKLLERRIQNAMMAPIKMVTQKTQGIFQRLMQAFTYFFLGWLTNKVIATLQDQTGRSENIFKAIFDSIIGGVTFFLKSLQFINKSLRGIIGIVSGTTKLLAKFITSTLGLLFKGLGKIGKGIVDAGKGLVTAGKGIVGLGPKAATESVDAAGKLIAKEGSEAAGKLVAKEGAETAGKSLFKKIPGFSIGAGLLFGGARLYQGDPLGAFGELASGIAGTFAGPGTAISLGIDALLLKRDIDMGMEQNKKTENQQQSTTRTTPRPAAASVAPTPPATKPLSPVIPTPTATEPSAVTSSPLTQQPTVQPTTPTVLSASDFQFGVDNSGKMEMDFSQPAESGEITAPVSQGNVSADQKIQAQIAPAQTQRIPTPAAKVGPEPQQKPNIIRMSTMAPQSQTSSTVLQSSKGTAASDVPSIPSSNPSNFYTLYSQVNYNVVI